MEALFRCKAWVIGEPLMADQTTRPRIRAEAAAPLGPYANRYTVIGGLFIGLLLLGVAVATWNTRSSTLSDARRSIGQLGIALAEQTSRSMQGVDLVLQDTVNRLADGGANLRPGFGRLMATEDVHDLLRDRLRSVPQADAISIVDARGRLMNFTRSYPPPAIDLSDRDYFQFLKANAASGAFISAPVRNRGNAVWTVYLARRVSAANGDFLGLVLGAMSLDYLEEFYRAVTTKPGSSVSLLRKDGILLARFPHLESLIGVAPPDQPAWEAAVNRGGGTLTATRADDGQRRLVSVHLLPDYPLVVEVAVTESAALAGWRRQTLAIAAGSMLAAVCMAAMLGKIARQFNAQQSAQRVLSRRNAELEEVRARLEQQAGALAQTAEALRQGERDIAAKSETLQTTLENIDQGLMMVDADRIVAVYNQRAAEMLGLPEGLLARRPLFVEVLEAQWASGEFTRTAGDVVEFVKAGGILDQPHVYQRERPNGQVIEVRSVPLPDGGVVRTYTDITERKAAEARILHAANHDDLTGLANRAVLGDHLEAAIRECRATDTGLALLYLDLDRFKLINDARGHEVGDRLLIKVAQRMRAIVRETDLVARMGGDEFAIVQTAVVQPEAAAALAVRLTNRLSDPFVINGLRLTIGVSIGIAVFPDTGADAETLRRNADIAMYRAKDSGRNTFRVYEPAMAVRQQEQFLLEQDLREAVGTDALRLAYQPVVALQDDRIVGYEALLRWNHPVRGAVPPSDFVPLAEATGLIVPLGRWVLEAACAEAAQWPSQYRIAVNLSPVQFRQSGLALEIMDVLSRTGLSPDRLELEVTEGVLLEDTGSVLDTMTALHRHGVSITLDDFGTGHASLSYLRRFPFDKIKIDKSFIRNLGQDPQSDAIVEAILLLSRRLNLLVVAEGVETQEQFDVLRDMQCPLVQGFLTGRPMSAELARAG